MNRQCYLFITWLIAVIALIVTLYGSNVQMLPVCHLCWFQRVCLYPLVIILGIGAFQDDRKSAVYSLPLTIIATILALYQYILQWYPQLESIGVCGTGPSCADVHLRVWGFITYPFISMIGSLVMSILLIMALSNKKAAQ